MVGRKRLVISVRLRSDCSTQYVPGQAGATQTVSHQHPPKNFWHANPPSSGSNSISGKHLNHPKDAVVTHPFQFARALLCLQVLHGPSCAHAPQVSETRFICSRGLNPTPHQRDIWPLLCFCARSRLTVREPLGEHSPGLPSSQRSKRREQGLNN